MTGHRFSGWILLLSAAFALCVSSAPAAAARWEPLPLWGGEVELAAARGDSSVVYAASAAGLYQSADQGVTWQLAADAGPVRLLFDILGVDPHDPLRLFIVGKDELSASSVLFRSEDGGTHWQRSDTGIPTAASVSDMAFDPETPGQLYLATSSGLYGSQDWGTTWARRGLADKYVSRVAVDPGDPMVVLAVVPRIFSGGDLTLRSSDGGETFVQVFDEGMAFDFDPTRSGRLYGSAPSRGLSFSDDSGAHWTSLPNAPLYGRLRITPEGTLLMFLSDGVSRSLDGGVTWDPVPGLRSPEFFSSFVVLEDGTLLAGGRRGVWRSRTDGEGWLFSSTGIQAQAIHVLAVAADAVSTLWVGPGAGLFLSRDAGASFQARPGGLDPFGFLELLAVHPRRPRVAYTFGCCGVGPFFFNLLKTEDEGRSWRRLNPGVGIEVAVLAVDPVNPDFVYAGSLFAPHNGGACTAVRSTDGGATWSCMGPGPLFHFTALAIDPLDRRVLYGLFNRRLYRSSNRGRTWAQVPTAGLEGEIRQIVVDPTRRNRLWALPFLSSGVFRSDDGGRTWTRVAAGLPATAMMHDLLVDPARPGRLWVALEVFDPETTMRQGFVFRSDDAGRRWRSVSAGLSPRAVVTHLAADPRGADILYAGTDGQGLYRLVVEE